MAGDPSRCQNVHISIIDTKRLPDSNLIFWTPALAKVLPGLQVSCFWEFLASGTISGPAHKAVKYDELVDLGVLVLEVLVAEALPPLHLREPGLNTTRWYSAQEAISLKMRIAEPFGQDFAIPVAVYLLSWYDSVDEQTAVDLLAEADIPQAWHEDPTIMTGDVFTGGLEEVLTAIALLRKLAGKAHGHGESAEMKSRSGEPETVDPELVRVSQSEEQKAMLDPKRIPKMVKDLDIDMVGW
ncbi:hypothetical protein LTR37_009828 [Vermiconidia calcicola]|uniref:Uncharacterized protein n=1 Tax=Vermiconidia calcicola TaxID=1690605 RepID=A0ACC3N8H5_9PEZI|nr:hypothetical protein LTR37_009828 [Vermiconidia calcicola]